MNSRGKSDKESKKKLISLFNCILKYCWFFKSMYKELKGQRFFEMNEGKDYLDSNFNVLLNNDSHCMGVGDKY